MDRPSTRAVFLDRDGVINAALWNRQEGKWDSPYRLGDFRLLPGAAQAVRRINEMGFLAVVVSNQPGVAKGKCRPGLLDALDAKMIRLLAQKGAHLDAIYYCVHHPEAQVEELRRDCECRKPQPGLLWRAAQDLGIDLGRSYLVGDQWADVEAGAAAGCQTILLDGRGVTPASRQGSPSPSLQAQGLLAAVGLLRQGA